MEKRTYFASDFHLGIDGAKDSLEREKTIVRWLEQIQDQAAAIYLVGDIFDFWFEYKRVIPKGDIRLFGKLAELRDADVPVYYFTGNHDMWMFRYMESELGIPTYREPIEREIGGKQFLIGHGDGLGPGDHGYKFLKKVFANRTCQWLFERLHPNFGIGLANYWSHKSRTAGNATPRFEDIDQEWLYTYANEYLAGKTIDYFIFGHRHLAIDYALKNSKSRYINLGEWIVNQSYAVFDGQDLRIQFFENPEGVLYSDRP
ncbi:MAG: UDP-2,3-diacylglucosamine diphosphatase [Phaeodactylibacter sp.]|nr:UDP-2,3-diacylglucosamine diphosphatase [Phaeodactylibacter sp.]